MARKKKLKENVRDEIEVEEEGDSSDSDSSGFLTHSTFNESKEQRRNRSAASTPAKPTPKSPRKSNPGSGSTKAGKTLRSPLKEKSRNIPGKVRGRPPTSTPLQRSPGRKKLVGTPKSRKFRPGTRALMEIRFVEF